MKITKRELKQMINESVKEILNEHRDTKLISYFGSMENVEKIIRGIELIYNKKGGEGILDMILDIHDNPDSILTYFDMMFGDEYIEK